MFILMSNDWPIAVSESEAMLKGIADKWGDPEQGRYLYIIAVPPPVTDKITLTSIVERVFGKRSIE